MEQRDATTTLSFSSTVENVSLEVPPIVPMPTVAPNPPPLQVYYRRTQAPLTTPPIDPPTSSPTTNALLPLLPTHKYPIALCKSIWFTRNDNPKYAFTLKCDHLTPSYFSFISSLDFVPIPKSQVKPWLITIGNRDVGRNGCFGCQQHMGARSLASQ